MFDDLTREEVALLLETQGVNIDDVEHELALEQEYYDHVAAQHGWEWPTPHDGWLAQQQEDRKIEMRRLAFQWLRKTWRFLEANSSKTKRKHEAI